MKAESAAHVQECQWCGEPVEYRDHHATQWECILALVGKCDQLQRERDDFEQRLHAYKRGEYV